MASQTCPVATRKVNGAMSYATVWHLYREGKCIDCGRRDRVLIAIRAAWVVWFALLWVDVLGTRYLSRITDATNMWVGGVIGVAYLMLGYTAIWTWTWRYRKK